MPTLTDVALGSRMGKESCMPWVRTLGNRIYALVLSILSNQRITYTASGMRVMRRDRLAVALGALRPLEPWLRSVPLGRQYLVLATPAGEGAIGT